MATFTKVMGPGSDGKSPEEFPTPFFPTVYCDGVLSLTRASPNVKIYLYRMDPHPFAQGGANQVPTVQVVMPEDAFAGTMVFMAEQLALLIKDKKVPAGIATQIIAHLNNIDA